MDFNSIEGNITVLGRFIGEELITKLFETGRFKVIERSLLEKAIEELKFNTSDLVDPSIAKQVGKVVGADAIVTGTLADLGQSVKVNARVIMVESGEIIGAAGAQIVKDSSIGDMLMKVLARSNSIRKTEEHGIARTDKDVEINEVLEGRWSLNANGWVGYLDIKIVGEGRVDGKMVFTEARAVRNYPINTIRGSIEDKIITFDRIPTENPRPIQNYRGVIDMAKKEIKGNFTGAGGGGNWRATKE